MSQVSCPNCGKLTASARELSKYHYKESGLDNLWLLSGVTETTCAACGETFVRVWNEPQLLQVIALDLLVEPRQLSGSELRFIRRSCGMSQSQLAIVLKCRRETVAEREARQNPGLSFPEEVGLRWLLLKAFQNYVTVPGNSSLEASQLKDLWEFARVFREFSARVETVRRRQRLTAEVRENIWTVDTGKRAA